MASTSIASGIHSLGAHSALRNQNEGLCCLRRSLHDHARFARGFLQQYNSCCSNLQLGGKNPTLLNATSNEDQPANDDEKGNDPSSADDGFFQASQDSFRKNLENMIGADDESFCGKDLAMLIRNKYGRSYDVQLIKKEFMGRQLLAMNVMWKYREQRSFPLTEEEYLLRLDDVANNLRCWGAVSYVRSSLAKTKERPRIGKAVSIFIDLDESGGRANEWIYR